MSNFSWLVSGRIAGAGQPGGPFYDPRGDQSGLLEDLDELAAQGIGALVSLTEQSLRDDLVQARGLRYLHLPVEDMQAPALEEIAEFVEFVGKAQDEQRPVAVHCRAGMGRTGTMLACYLVSQGFGAREALAAVRQKRPGSVETPEQEAVVYRYADYLELCVQQVLESGGNGRPALD